MFCFCLLLENNSVSCKLSGCNIRRQAIFWPEPDSKKLSDIRQPEPDIWYIPIVNSWNLQCGSGLWIAGSD